MTKKSILCHLQLMSYQRLRVQLTKHTQFQYYLDVSHQKFFRGPKFNRPWTKPLKPSGAAYRRLKANRERI